MAAFTFIKKKKKKNSTNRAIALWVHFNQTKHAKCEHTVNLSLVA